MLPVTEEEEQSKAEVGKGEPATSGRSKYVISPALCARRRRPQYSEVRSMTKGLRWDLRMPKLAEVNALRETSRGVGLLELAIRGHPR